MHYMIKRKDAQLFVGVSANQLVMVRDSVKGCKVGALKFFNKESAIAFFRYMTLAHNAKVEDYELHTK